ncbi:MAG: hypothetical protein KDA55_01165, partial [Planctomycetales bacterium]|nr:hypothetical protein [Planctomycetales bacterium]
MLRFPVLSLLMLATTASAIFGDEPDREKLTLHMRSQVEKPAKSGEWLTIERETTWDARATAIVICDMWDDHYCRASARRVAEMAPRMNQVIKQAREMGVLIIHSPSGCMDQYQGTTQRQLAQQAPKFETEIPLQNWCYLDDKHESEMPVSVGSPCDDDGVIRDAVRFFDRQIDTLEIADGDAITDSAEAFYF